MASGLIFDPHALLRTAPLITSTCTLWYSLDQEFFLNIFLHPSHRTRSNETLPSYFGVFFVPGTVRVLGLLALTLTGGGYNILTRRSVSGSSASLPWYTAGTLLAASHLLFVPAVAPKIQAMVEDSSKGRSTEDLEGWLTIHRVRTWTVDFAAWACFAVAMSIVE
ncbi:hypothetical protein PENARI_c002G00101 [Penicillium arizonense]|jgi:hypothetical protein|uniref:Integral membrane protein n=1 Tax=Penicillium arizonense TaxID=1835702 RepID=A0A1F5LWJ5_PENAI|nr:hypothetical protein PENARI_c002G00101 [Penicillium arizonense]OGE57528.1 hypothetical protein PENARI_c002G00101 [Penicillium arizonense]